ncbi:hypothetical protein ACFSCX_16080 [Bacillus salitolerans]|uniref:Uncharacterized protein n=1 Tax=Bacillus salitolerans TaxID=1437434 RepID=A0ABW4LTE4_9BACI
MVLSTLFFILFILLIVAYYYRSSLSSKPFSAYLGLGIVFILAGGFICLISINIGIDIGVFVGIILITSGLFLGLIGFGLA